MDVAADSSVLVAAAIGEHPHHVVSETRIADERDRLRLVSHTVLETFATLTGKLYRRDPDRVRVYLAQFLGRPLVGIPAEVYPEALEQFTKAGIQGASVYDALIALSAQGAGVKLISLDSRARRTYERIGVEYELLLES